MKEVRLISGIRKEDLKLKFKSYCQSINKSMSEVLRIIIRKELKENSLMGLEDPLTEFMQKYTKRTENNGIERKEFRKHYNEFRDINYKPQITANRLNREIQRFYYIVIKRKSFDKFRYYMGIEWKYEKTNEELKEFINQIEIWNQKIIDNCKND